MYIAILSIFITTLTFFSSPMTLSCFMCQSIGLLLCLTSNARHTFICSYSLLPHHSVSDSHAHTNSVYYTKSLSTSTYSLSPSHDLFLSPSLPLSLTRTLSFHQTHERNRTKAISPQPILPPCSLTRQRRPLYEI